MRYKNRHFIKGLALAALLFAGTAASAQVKIGGNVYGGGNIGEVDGSTTVIVNDGEIGDKLRLQDRKIDNNAQITRVDKGNVYGGGNGFKITGYRSNGSPIFNNNNPNAGRVTGNTDVLIQGDAVVRRAVYGGGNIATVGVCTVDSDGVATYESGGKATVTIQGNALVGPKVEDLTTATDAERSEAATAFGMESMTLAQYTDTAFKYLGGNEGWVFGSSRGISCGAEKHLSFVDTTIVTVKGNAQVMSVFGGGENGHVQKGTNVIISGYAIVGGVPMHGPKVTDPVATPYTSYTISGGEYNDVTVKLKAAEGELIEDEFGVGRTIYRGNVFGGGKGTDFISWFAQPKYCYTSGRVYGNTTVTIEENAKIYNRVYGGGPIAAVGTFTYEDSTDPDNRTIIGIVGKTGHTFVTINGGEIGSYSATAGETGLNSGEVYGGGRGLPGRPKKAGESLSILHQVVDEAYVGHTHVTVNGGIIYNSVYGGGANGHVQGNTHVAIKGGTIGHDLGGWHGNVYAGGGGTARYKEGSDKKFSITAGRVFGNTNLDITDGTIHHNVYGGGSLASVGTYLNYNGVQQAYFGGGIATINITGGTIGTDGDENGMVFGSGRGEIAAPGNIMDTLTYMAYTYINIGKEISTGVYEGDAKIKGSVYGSGENGHVYLKSQVNVYSGTIGCPADDYSSVTEDNFSHRGNVYGAGCGTDQYTKVVGMETKHLYNPNAGYVWGQTEVNIYGGYISRNVYGGGAMGSVGLVNHNATVKHKYEDHATQPSLSWPYELSYVQISDAENQPYPSNAMTGKATVNVYGGHIGTLAAPVAKSGNVFGSCRGDVGPLGLLDSLAIVRETKVNINFEPTVTNYADVTDATPNVIIGSVYGSGEDGSVYEDTKVTVTNGLIGGSVFGGGSGTTTYKGSLKTTNGTDDDPSDDVWQDNVDLRSITAGKVYGNTEVEIIGGYITHNVYGGGNMASVGKGNYMGYGELSSVTATPKPCYSTTTTDNGKCTVNLKGGTIGTDGLPDANGNNNGFVYGSSKGITFPTVNNPDGTARYDYSRDFFLGYANETEVNIGDAEASTAPTIKGSVFGGGDNGHVRWNTDVTVTKGEIGVAYVAPATYPETDSLYKWVYRGNVYGAGRGIDKIGTTDDYCPSAGSVTLNTNVTVNNGTIHRNVYGGGSNASVGPPPTGYNPGNSLDTVAINGGTIGQKLTGGRLYGGDVFGGSRGARDLLATASISKVANVSNTAVSVNTGATVYGNVYGGGELGQVTQDTKVYMTGGIAESSVYGGGKGDTSDEKAAQVKGNATVDMTGGTVQRSVYGGGQLGNVGTYLTTTPVSYTSGAHNGKTVDVPATCEDETGLATVTISGGCVGLNGSLMPIDGHNPDDDDRGYIFCGGRGEADSIAYYKAPALGVVGSTSLEISDNVLILSSVYGGCENGLVLEDTYVLVSGGQIGTGYTGNGTTHSWAGAYSPTLWDNAIAAVQSENDAQIAAAAANFHECHSWAYTAPYYVYDIFAEKTGHPNNDDHHPDYQTAALVGTNGHSFFGNVFGGGSGYYPIATGVWRRSAGRVNGNTVVDIEGGHILTNVYGGNETTDVLGKCTINMSGGTVGIPRTVEQINANPTSCNIFGAGMGDFRTACNNMNNVNETEVNVTGGIVFGSVFGGSEEGHVLGNALVQVTDEDAFIGTTGTSGYDGHAFGGGKGNGKKLKFYEPNNIDYEYRANFAAGRVAGNATVTMTEGTVLGNLYGGGLVALVGVDVDGKFTFFIPGIEPATYDTAFHGMSTVNLSGGYIGGTSTSTGLRLLKSSQQLGNVYAGGRGDPTEYREDDYGRVAKAVVNVSGSTSVSGSPFVYGSVFGGGQMANVGYWLGYGPNQGYAKGTSLAKVNISGGTIGTALEFTKSYADLGTSDQPKTEYEEINSKKRLSHSRTGNVYGSGQGDVKLDENGYVVGLEHGHCGKAHVFISGSPTIMSSVYGGADRGVVWGNTDVNISGGTIGTEANTDDDATDTSHANNYYYGSVYGGCFGMDGYMHLELPNTEIVPADRLEQVIDSVNGKVGRIYGDTRVKLTGGTVLGNVFGGGNLGIVDGNTDVKISKTGTGTGPVIGPLDGTGLNAYVYGGGKGFSDDPTELRKKYANVTNTKVTVDGGTIYGSVLGGGSDSHVLGNTEVFVHDGANIGTDGLSTWDGNIFGGGRNYLNSNHTNGRVGGNTTITMDGGTIKGSIFGGGRMALTGVNEDGDPYVTGHTYDSLVGNVHGLATIHVSGGFIGNDNPWELLDGSDESVGDIFGSGKGDTKEYEDILGGRVANTKIDITGNPRIYGAVYGGGEMASVGYWYEEDGKAKFYANSGTAVVNVGGTAEIGTDFEFTHAYATSTDPKPSYWTVFGEDGKLIHTCTGNVCGGAQGDVDTISQHWVSMGRSRRAYVTIGREGTNDNPIIKSRVFGGPEQGSMAGDAYVKVNGGTIGTMANADDGNADNDYLFGGVFGGGYGSHNPIFNGTTYIGEDNQPVAIVNDSTYASHLVTDELWTANYLAGRVYGDTRVDVLGGTIQGYVFGGGSFAYVGGYGSNAKGNTLVNIGAMETTTDPVTGDDVDTYSGDAIIQGSVYGANNLSGTPYGNTNVNIYKTNHTGDKDTYSLENPNYAGLGNSYPNIPDYEDIPNYVYSSHPEHFHLDSLRWLDTLPRALSNFAIHEVFGGSNKAHYVPYADKSATVHVYQCDDNTIYDVYGGSNAADVGDANTTTNTNVIVDGGRIFRVFGGGNGESRASNIHGTANTRINAGLINEVYGGSNTNGSIDNINLLVDPSEVCPELIGDVFGGTNAALVLGDVITTINCCDAVYGNFYGGANLATIYGNVIVNIKGATYKNLFAGSKGNSTTAADIKRFPSHLADVDLLPEDHRAPVRAYLLANPDAKGTGGNVTLNIFGGRIKQAAFGGCDVNGNIEGKITVNVLNLGGPCDLDLMNLFGAGRDTDYEPLLDTVTGEKIVSPVVNVIHGKVGGSVFGGGEGTSASADTDAHPVVNIGYDASMLSIVNDLKDKGFVPNEFDPATDAHAQVVANVYGGGDMAEVYGDPTVNITRANTEVKGHVYGGGHGDDSDVSYGKVNGSTTVNIDGGQIGYYEYNSWADMYFANGGNVFGGGEMAKVTGNASVDMSGGRLVKNLFGGGMGSNVDGPEFGGIDGNTYVNVSGSAVIDKNVYGGGQMGSVGSGNLTDKNSGVAHVTVSGGTIGTDQLYADLDDITKDGNVYGGGMGGASNDFKDYANVDSTAVVITDAARVYGSVYGGSANGHVLGGTLVQVSKDTNTPTIGTTGLSGEDGHVYGGGQGTTGSFTAGRVGGITKVEISDGNILGCVFGGGRMALTGVDVNGSFSTFVDNNNVYDTIHHGTTHVEITGGVIGNHNNNGNDLLTSDQVSGNVYGAGRGDPDEHKEDDWGRVAKSVLSISGSPTIYGSVYGGGQMANVGHWLDYTGWYAKGTSATTVNITGSPTIGTEREFSQAYASTNPTKTLYETINGRKMIVHTRTGNVYGSGQGDVKLKPNGFPEGFEQGHCGKTFVNISETPTIMGSVFGGAEQGAVWGNTRVDISGGVIGTMANNDDDTGENANLANNHYFGSVFGGSYGKDAYIHLGMNPNTVLPRTVDSINGLSGRVYGNTYVNITGGTIRENVFGGGDMASVGEVNDDGTLVNGKCTVNVSGSAIVGPLDGTGLNGYVYGGGKGIGNDPDNLRKKYCNVHETEVIVDLTFTDPYDANGISRPNNWDEDYDGRVWGSIFGGGADGHVLGDTKVKLISGLIGDEGKTSWDGNIFGGGRNFQLYNYTAGRVGGNVTVEMTGGHLLGSLYGGGRNAITGLGEDVTSDASGVISTLQDGDHGNITVMVKGGVVGNNQQTGSGAIPETVIDGFTDSSMGSVYGGGKGTESGIVGHTPESALLIGMVKNTDVQISQVNPAVPTRVYGIVFGGGEKASVGNCTWKQPSPGTFTEIDMKDDTGLAKVTISGGIIGGDKARMRPDLQSYADDDNFWPLYNDDLGYVYGGGEGTSADPTNTTVYPEVNTKRFGNLPLLDIMAAVNNTKVLIAGGLVKASVFGGAEAGHVLQNTKVILKGGQIGVGYDEKTDTEFGPYNDIQFVDPTEGIDNTNALFGTIHWDFGADDGHGNTVYNPYDLVDLKNHINPSDGKSWFGNVFGGGSGWFPYISGDGSTENPYKCSWNSNSGKVWGNTEVIIADSINDVGGLASRPHILNNVYGGNEMSDIDGTATITMIGGTIGVPRTREQINDLPTFGYLFGGGCGDPRPESKTLNNVGRNTIVNVTGGIIYGSVYGGAEDGHVLGNAEVHVGQDDIAATPTNPTIIGCKGTSKDDGNIFGGGRNYLLMHYTSGRVGGNTTVEMTGGHALGSIYGGGRNAVTGLDEDLILSGTGTTRLVKALQDDTDSAHPDHGHTLVQVKGGKVGNKDIIETWLDNSIGDVYGGGKGSMVGPAGHPDAVPLLISLVKSTTVEISEVAPTKHKTYVYGNVFGGGEVANVGNYTWNQDFEANTISNIAMMSGTGKATVSVNGGRIGLDEMVMSYRLIGGSGPDRFLPATTSCGNVFGGGEGLSADPETYSSDDINTALFGDKYLIDLIATVGETEVTIGETGKPWVKGSVYGGSAMGHVLGNTNVTIANGQIGAGYDDDTGTEEDFYDDDLFFNTAETTVTTANAMKPTYHWDFDASTLQPFDLLAIYNGITGAGVYTYIPTDGRTWFGNVYGGGSGFLPYIKETSPGSGVYEEHWNRESGRVYGNSNVTITGGHILSNVYGGCETADVGMYTYNNTIHGYEHNTSITGLTNNGTATVTMTGGTVGVPLTGAQIEARPMTGMLFGSGKGDPREYFNTWTNVNEAVVDIQGGKIYGSVFGSGEEGHVLGDVDMDISQVDDDEPTVIGSVGNTYYDGNVFGGGRGFTGQALTAGSVGGNVDVNVTGGTMLGSVYGGGSLASVGTYLVDAKVGTADNPYYGKMQPYNPAAPYAAPDATEDAKHGNITVTISGGKVGNEIETPTHANPVTKGGNVFGACKGRFIAKTGSETPIWPSLARVKETEVTITGTAVVKNSVYGGGEIGTVRKSATVNVSGGTIGDDYGTSPNKMYIGSVFGGGLGYETTPYDIQNDSAKPAAYLAGLVYGNTNVNISGGQVLENVFGGGQVASVGMYNIIWNTSDYSDGASDVTPVANTGLATVKVTGGVIGPLDGTGRNAYVFGGSKGGTNSAMRPFGNVNTTVVEMNMDVDEPENPDDVVNRVWGSLFGGGDNGHVLGNATVTMKNGSLGTLGKTGYDGNIFGGGRNYDAVSKSAGRVGGNVTVNMMGGHAWGSIFGGGRLGSVGVNIDGAMQDGTTHGFTTVNVGGANQVNNVYIGHEAEGSEDRVGGNVYGGGKGIAGSPSSDYPDMAKVKQTLVNIHQKSEKETFIEGSVFGSGEDGHVLKDTYVNVFGGQVGGKEWEAHGTAPQLCNDHFHGNVYGGGRGLDMYDSNGDNILDAYSETAGEVFGNTYVYVAGGRICRNVYGGGNLASVGTYPEGSGSTGRATVTITGNAIIGVNPDNDNRNGSVFGAGRGQAGAIYKNLSLVRNTDVTITGDAEVLGNVYGSGEDGHVIQRTNILIGDASIHIVAADGTVSSEASDVDGSGVEIGKDGANEKDGYVFGAGRGLEIDPVTNTYSPTAGIVGISTNVVVNNGVVKNSVFGGGRLASVGHEHALDSVQVGDIYKPKTDEVPTDFGKATVLITGKAKIGISGATDKGHVFGSGMGKLGFASLTSVFETHVTINGDATVYGSVYGGGEVGHVRTHTVEGDSGDVVFNGDTYVTIGGNANVGSESNHVFGGGHGDLSSVTAGKVDGIARVTVKDDATVNGSVAGGGQIALVDGARIVNIEGGTVKRHVLGGNYTIPDGAVSSSLRTVNVRGGSVEGNVYGGSFNASEGNNLAAWNSFVNITGGTIGNNVYAASYGGTVNGSVNVNIGRNAVDNAPTYLDITAASPENANIYRYDGGTPNAAKLKIGGSVFGGSYQHSEAEDEEWSDDFDIRGFSTMYIDGDGYDTQNDETTNEADPTNNPYMNIGTSIYGCGNRCESAEKGRSIFVRKYGQRENNGDGSLSKATRDLKTIQRSGIVIFDEVNLNLTGDRDLSNKSPQRQFAILQVDSCVYMTNASSLNIGATNNTVYMDSISTLRSLLLVSGTSYDQAKNMQLALLPALADPTNPGPGYWHTYGQTAWDMVGINSSDNTSCDNKLYRIHGSSASALNYAGENVIVFNDESKLFVRNKFHGTLLYGELNGFFRMRSNFTPVGTQSFAYARPKLTDKVNPLADYPTMVGGESTGNTWNAGDGGFLSYDNDNNTFTLKNYRVAAFDYTYPADGNDGGAQYTNTKQYPYFNISQAVRDNTNLNMQQYRQWVLPDAVGERWYVDGRGVGNGGWGKDESHRHRWGHFPDMPKQTITGTNGIYKDKSTEETGFFATSFNAATDIIFVVGPINTELETEELNLTMSEDPSEQYTLKLYRYPGGHQMSNNNMDETTTATAPESPASDYDGLYNDAGVHLGPGANKGMMIDVKDNLVLENVWVDGMYAESYEADVMTTLGIPETYTSGTNAEKLKVTEPMVVTHSGATLTLKGGTQLVRGYNNTDATTNNYYLNSDYSGSIHNGGGLYLDPGATLNVEGLVTVTDSKQKNGSSNITSNVYLPTFDKAINVTAKLNSATRIGVTSPIRKQYASTALFEASTYNNNTFSPVAVFDTGDTDDDADFAEDAWENANFEDDLDWFFVNQHDPDNGSYRSTYYDASNTNLDDNTLYLGWTWSNVVRTQPSGYVVSGDADEIITVSDRDGLAWLINVVNGDYLPSASNLDDKTVRLVTDLDMKQYVWVPVGTVAKPFSGTFDGQGHLIKDLNIVYTGTHDRKYNRSYYGLFGTVNGGELDRVFLVGSRMEPEGNVNIGGLTGRLQGAGAKVTNSEAAVEIVRGDSEQAADNVIGGLVGYLIDGEIHSSMAMPSITAKNGYLGGLVGSASDPAEGSHTGVKLRNSFANAKFNVGASNTSVKVGGVIGHNVLATVENCYGLLQRNNEGNIASTGLSGTNFGSVVHTNNGTVRNSYGLEGYSLSINGDVTDGSTYTATMDADNLGYMYYDNVVTVGTKKVGLFRKLNQWVAANGSEYASWARPAIPEINGDYPVLMLCNYSDEATPQEGLGEFRSLATYNNGTALQYGGTVRDGDQLNTMLGRSEAIYVYGDVDETETLTTTVVATKVSINEHAAIVHPGTLADYANTYVGVTFDNSKGSATSSQGVNYEVLGLGPYALPRDWHMFSSPLQEAPLGFEYYLNGVQTEANNTNKNTYTTGTGIDQGTYYNNYWSYPGGEFSWINGGGNYRYWLKGWENSQSQNTTSPTFMEGNWKDGYFPSKLGSLFSFGQGCIEGTDEYGRYPYGMDLYTWTEPDYHWINFKRNGPNHWYSEANANGHHDHIDYQPFVGAPININEEELIVGRGYMASISDTTFMQSHGQLNAGSGLGIALYKTDASKAKGMNLIGNPYHAYLDFDLFADPLGVNKDLINDSYVVYDADKYHDFAESAFHVYPVGGSVGGAYAGQYLHPHQGFFVMAKLPNEKVTFTEDMIATRKDSKFRGWRPNYPLVNLYLSSTNGCADITVVEFNRPEWGGATKLKHLRQGNGTFYAYHDNVSYAALFAKEGTERVPLWFEPKEDDVFTIKWNTANGDFHGMWLIDNLTGILYDMIENDSYTFVGHKGDYASRFYIVFNVTDVEENTEDNTFVFYDGSQWIVTGDGELEFIDLNGQLLWHQYLGGGQHKVSLPWVANGMYMFRLTNGHETKVQKVIVNR